MRIWKRIVGIVVAASLVAGSLGGVDAMGKDGYRKHVIEQGASREGNPLKGLFAYGGKTNMPVSMEYFSMPVNAVQKGMNEYDWSELEKRLNAAAGRGYQVVMRFYYDEPGKESGIPDFLIQEGLETRAYDGEQLGGGGICPDYSDTYFRQSMQEFIAEFGKQYDGDGRIGFVTLGMLGFWGEWHNWPYDEDKNTKAFFQIPTEVQKEVLDSFEHAFTVTKLCARTPKKGIDFSEYHVGFHDDSFCYETLSQANGGNDSSFMQKLKNANLSDVWQRECIGGEIYPSAQNVIFSDNIGAYQDWNLCMEEAHASWMLCNRITTFSGSILDKAKDASKKMGYDLRVKEAYYNDVNVDKDFYVGINMENIGVAPFYYDHRTWPVVLGVKQNGNVVKTWETDWDLCKVEAGKTKEFEMMIPAGQLAVGEYTLCMKVQNPVENGNILGFANKNQGEDGWLELDSLSVKEAGVEITTEDSDTDRKLQPNQDSSEKSTEVKGNTATSSTENNAADGISRKKQKITTAKIKKYKAKNLKVKKVSFSLKAKTTGDGKLTYKVTKYPEKGKKYIKVSKKGKVTLKKNTPKGMYQITITAAQTKQFEKSTKKVKIKVK